MKLIVRDDVHEGQMFRTDAFAVFGRLIETRGWYVSFNFRFIRKHTNAGINLTTWQPYYALCYYRTLLTARRRFKDDSWMFKAQSWWNEL